MKRSKIILLFKFLVLILFLVSIIRIILFNINYKLYKNNGNNYGVITNINKKDNYTLINIKSDINYKAYLYSNNNLDFGDNIYFEYTNKIVENSGIFNTFNYKEYLKSKDINQIITINKYKVIKNNKFYKYKGLIYKKILNKKSNKYIFTFLCGDKSYLDNDIKKTYINNGVSHLLCISGFHVVFLFSNLKKLFKFILRKEILVVLLLIMFSILYLILTNFMIALFRAIIMYFFNYINKRFNININNLYYYFLTLLISLILWPNILYDISFYYTYILSFFLIINKYNLNNVFKVSIYTFVISMPLTLYFNYNINLLSFLHSTLSSFIVCYMLYPFSFIAIISNKMDLILYKMSYLFELINIKIDKITHFKVVIPKISIIILIIIYLLYFIYVIKLHKRLIYINILLFIYLIFSKYLDPNNYIYFINVKQGDMSLIISKYHKNVSIIDTGGIVSDTYLKYNIKTFLYSVGVNKINNLIITHGDYDHMGEAINLVNNFKVEKVIFNCGELNKLELDLIGVLNKKRIPYYSCIKELNIDDNKLYFLQTKEYDNENNNSNVVYTEIDGYKFMFMGDAGVDKEKDILEKYNISNIDILKVGHHGSKTSSGENFINRINPKYSIISVGKNNRYGHPNKEVLNNLEKSKIFRTDLDGSTMFKIENRKLEIETCSS